MKSKLIKWFELYNDTLVSYEYYSIASRIVATLALLILLITLIIPLAIVVAIGISFPVATILPLLLLIGLYLAFRTYDNFVEREKHNNEI